MERELSHAQILHTCTRDCLVTQVQILGLASELKASNEIAKQRLLEDCGSERIYVLPCESSSFTILWLSVYCVLSGPFVTAGSHAYTHTVPVVIVGLYIFWKQDSQSRRRTSKHHWRACRSSTLYAVSMVQQIQLLASSIVPTVRWCYDKIHFPICILTLTITGLQHFR